MKITGSKVVARFLATAMIFSMLPQVSHATETFDNFENLQTAIVTETIQREQLEENTEGQLPEEPLVSPDEEIDLSNPIKSLSFMIGGVELPVEIKTEYSLLPLPEKTGTLDLSSFTAEDLDKPTTIHVTFADGITDGVLAIAKGTSYTSSDDFTIVRDGDFYTLEPLKSYNSSYQLTIIASSGDQVDDTNTKYTINVSATVYEPWSNIIDELIGQTYLYEKGNSIERSSVPCENYSGSNYLGMIIPKKYRDGNEYDFDVSIAVSDINDIVYGDWKVTEIADVNGTELFDLYNDDHLNTEGYSFSFENYYSDEWYITIQNDSLATGSYTSTATIWFDVTTSSSYIDPSSYLYNSDSYFSSSYRVTDYYSSNYEHDCPVYIYQMKSTDYPAEEEYYVYADFSYVGEDNINGSGYDGENAKAFIGVYDSLKEAEDADAENIADALLAVSTPKGYKADYSGDGITFSVFTDIDTFHFTVKSIPAEEYVEPEPGIPTVGTTLTVNGFGLPNSMHSFTPVFKLTETYDSFYTKYQTFLSTNESDVSAVVPYYNSSSGSTVSVNGEIQSTGVTEVDFKEDNVAYAVLGENSNGSTLQNYFVTIGQKENNGKGVLYVNGPKSVTGENIQKTAENTRNIFLLSENSYHDIFIANLGDQKLDNVSVSFSFVDDVEEWAEPLLMDDYWTLHETSVLYPFDTHDDWYNSNSENIYGAKIRINPNWTAFEDKVANVMSDAQLVVTAGDQSYTVFVSAIAGTPVITTEAPQNAVKYIPYSSVIQTNNNSDYIKTKYYLEGILPDGFSLDENTGEIYGVTSEVGTFDIRVVATFEFTSAAISLYPEISSHWFDQSYLDYTLEVLDNSDKNVEWDNGLYGDDESITDTLTQRVVDFSLDDVTNQEFISSREYGDFQDFYLNGVKLEKDVDYTHEEGSTKISINDDTFSKASSGTQTIAAEFRTQEGVMNATSQNYTATPATPPTPPTPTVPDSTGSNSNSNSSGSSSSSGNSSSSGSSSGSNSSGGMSSANSSSSSMDTTTTEDKIETTIIAPEHGTLRIFPEEPKKNDLVTVDAEAKEGYQLDAVILIYADGKESIVYPDDKGEFTFVHSGENVQVTAVFNIIPTDLPYSDLPSTHWAYEAISYVYNAGLMYGISKDNFGPDISSNRSMIIQMLYRLAGDDVQREVGFDDVPTDSWFAQAVAWGKESNMISGVSPTSFAPNADVEREQLALILYNYLELSKIDLPKVTEAQIADIENISPWAVEAVTYMVEIGLFAGRGDGVFDPQDYMLRSELAYVFYAMEVKIEEHELVVDELEEDDELEGDVENNEENVDQSGS